MTDEQIRMKVLAAVRSMLSGLVSSLYGSGQLYVSERLDLGLGPGGLQSLLERSRPWPASGR